MESTPGRATKVKKQWKGEKRGGPAPARHIPWPEIFKHHISVVEGHLRMMEMIQKHTVQGTGNHTTITAIVKRCHEMLYQTKDSTRAFAPPKNQRETVPLGSSSLSMYPGYSPEDIEYGKAAGEAGQAIGAMRKKGLQWEGPGNGAEYQIGQAHGAKRKVVFHKEKIDTSGSEDVVTADGAADEAALKKAATKETGGEQIRFVIDLNPTPMSASTTRGKPPKKRALEDGDEGSLSKKSKKEKKEKEIIVETEDISAEVEVNLKAKEEKAKEKEEKKRRRSNGGETEQAVKKPKKEKSKKRETEPNAERSGDGEGKKKRKTTKDSE